MEEKQPLVPEEIILDKILYIRGQKVMLDTDLAKLYGVETKQLKRQVNRNIDRFPGDFMFELTKEELEHWRCQFGPSNPSIKMGLRHLPYAFTEQGIAMLSSVLNSQQAIRVNIQIIRVFTRVRQMLLITQNYAWLSKRFAKKWIRTPKISNWSFDISMSCCGKKNRIRRRVSVIKQINASV